MNFLFGLIPLVSLAFLILIGKVAQRHWQRWAAKNKTTCPDWLFSIYYGVCVLGVALVFWSSYITYGPRNTLDYPQYETYQPQPQAIEKAEPLVEDAREWRGSVNPDAEPAEPQRGKVDE